MIATGHELAIDIGGIPVLVRTDSAEFADMLADRYGEFVAAQAPRTEIELEIRIVEPGYGKRDTGDGIRESGVGRGTSGLGPRTSDTSSLSPNPQSLTPESDPESRAPSPESRVPDLDPDADLTVSMEQGRWVMERGDFRAEWDPETKRGWVRTSVNQYSIDGVLRILHSLILAREGGLLVHGASVIRNGRAFVFAGISGTGKTTISRLAPPDVTLLTDEISYLRDMGYGTRESTSRARDSGLGIRDTSCEVRGPEAEGRISDSRFKIQDAEFRIPYPEGLLTESDSAIENRQSTIENPNTRVPSPEPRVPNAYQAYGTPFAGELARIGVKTEAPLAGLFLLQQGPENRIEPVSEGEAVRELMRHILFFAHDPELVELVFQSVCDLVKRVTVKRLVFKKDASVWELIT